MVSVVIVNYNTFKLTCSCIQSVIDRTFGVKYEIIVVDNASEECKPEQFLTHFPQVKLVKNKQNLGFAKGNNKGIEHAQGEIILLLNSDTELLNDAITIASNKLLSDENIGVISGQLTYPDGQVQPVSGRFPNVKREIRELLRLNKRFNDKQRADYYLGAAFNHKTEKEVDWVWGAFFMFRKRDLKHFPGQKLHEDFFMYGEDVQWCYHFKKVVGKKILYTPEPKVVHYLGGSSHDTDVEIRHLTRMLPNEYRWMASVRGVWYAKLYYLVKALHHMSLRKKEELEKARVFLSFARLNSPVNG